MIGKLLSIERVLPQNILTSLDFNYVKPCFDLLQFKYNFLTLGQKDFLIQIVFV